jgi:hypothetical protein
MTGEGEGPSTTLRMFRVWETSGLAPFQLVEDRQSFELLSVVTIPQGYKPCLSRGRKVS